MHYQVPLYRSLAEDRRVDFKTFFASSGGVRPHDAGYGSARIVWGGDLLAGYEHEFLAAADENELADGFWGLCDADVVGRLRGERPDVLWVHGFTYATLALGVLAARALGIPVLLREDQTLLHERPWPKRWVREAALRMLFSQVYGLYTSSHNYDYFRRFGVPPQRLFFAPYAVDNGYFRGRARELAAARPALRARLGVEGEGPVVLFVGRLVGRKAPDLLLEAFRRVRSRNDCALVFVGDGELRDPLQRQVVAQRIPDVHFAGFLNQLAIPAAYAAADVFVLPSRLHETFGFVVLEAMNFGLPVITSDKVGSARDLVRDGVNGYVFPSGDAASLAAHLDRLVGDQAGRRQLGEGARRIVDRRRHAVAADGVVTAANAAIRRRAVRL
jgi:glycosyltransferase involved in cell wall biosynthesis